MTFANPLALLVLLPIVGAALLLRHRHPALLAQLPGAWRALVEPAMHRHVGRYLSGSNRQQAGWCLAIAALLAIALARPVFDRGDTPVYANLAGRIAVIDMASSRLEEHRLQAQRLVMLSPAVPVALVAAASEAFTVVPLTTDSAYLDRYLRVLTRQTMPIDGRALATGIAHAESILGEAGIVNRQIIVMTAGPAPVSPVRIASSGSDRVLLVPNGETTAWETAAAAFDARIDTTDAIERTVVDHEQVIARQLRDGLPGSTVALAPWLAGLAALAFLVLFRRRSGG